jgi:hypothetical protein
MTDQIVNSTRVFSEFVLPPKQNIYERYTFRLVEKPDVRTHVVVEQHNLDGSSEDIFEYDRNYSMMKTFEPFRQLKNGVWHDYALISTRYTRFEVLDLEARSIIATCPYPVSTQAQHDDDFRSDAWKKANPVGTEQPGWGFCPVEFYVPDWYTKFDDSYIDDKLSNDSDDYMFSEAEFMNFTGQWALYSGCVWGDDSGGWKLRHIDLSRISEGIVTADQRYGYVEVAVDSLKKIEIDYEDAMLRLPVFLYVDSTSGEAHPLHANWAKK